MSTVKELYEQAEELLDLGNSHEKTEGNGMKRILDEFKDKVIIENIDWSELRNQKRTLIEAINYIDEVDIEFDERTDTQEIVNNLTGILHLLDAIQDYAVDVMGLSPIHIYDFEDEENRDD